MKKILEYFKYYKWQSVLGPLFKLLEATFELFVPVIVGLIVDRGLGESINGAYPNADTTFVVWMCVLLAVFGLVGFAFSVTAQYFSAKAATGVCARARKDLFQKIQSLSYADLDKLGTSTMLTRMTSDMDRLQSGINLALRLFLRSPFIVFGAMLTAYFVHPESIGVFALTILALAIVVYAVMFACMPLYKKSQEKLDKTLLSTRENLTGARVLRAFCQEENERELFDERNEELNKSRKFVGAIAAITNPLTYALVNVGIVALLYTGAIRVDSGSLSQGSILALYNLMAQILIELIKLANLIVTVTKAVACGSRIGAVLEMQPSILLTDGEINEQGGQDNPFVQFVGVEMKYNQGGDSALRNISFDVRRGETVGVIGGTGSGKTTLVNLIPHYYDVSGGQVCVDGVDVTKKHLQGYLRERIGVVPQKAMLFKGTIKENLLWGRADATDEELWDALAIAQADEIVQGKGGLDAVVEQGGKNFSGGQKQRLTIARALVRKPEILILDDSASALDYATEAAIRKSLSKLDATVFIVSQRASSVRHADKILVLDDGELVGQGSHDELLKTCEVYREIFDSQTAGGDAV